MRTGSLIQELLAAVKEPERPEQKTRENARMRMYIQR
jgi:hypothetical protein